MQLLSKDSRGIKHEQKDEDRKKVKNENDKLLLTKDC